MTSVCGFDVSDKDGKYLIVVVKLCMGNSSRASPRKLRLLLSFRLGKEPSLCGWSSGRWPLPAWILGWNVWAVGFTQELAWEAGMCPC